MKNITDVVVKAIKEAATEAAKSGVAVTVELEEGGFFPTERTSVKIVVTPAQRTKP